MRSKRPQRQSDSSHSIRVCGCEVPDGTRLVTVRQVTTTLENPLSLSCHWLARIEHCYPRAQHSLDSVTEERVVSTAKDEHVDPLSEHPIDDGTENLFDFRAVDYCQLDQLDEPIRAGYER